MLKITKGGLIQLVRAVALGLSILIILYLVILPLYPLIRYSLISGTTSVESDRTTDFTDAVVSASSTSKNSDANASSTPEPKISPKNNIQNRIIIKKIGVDAPIVESADEKYGLNHGAWHIPNTGNPIKQGNMVITGHRFKYLPPNNLTFFLIDKISAGDLIEIRWAGKSYNYEATGSKIVPATETSILNPTEIPILTIFSCDPIYSTENRLVVTAKPI